jgi:dipeptidyl aminopeptidase/acylaminoacyl peptidase
MINDARFISGDKRGVMVVFFPHGDQSAGTTEYQQNVAGSWQMVKQTKGEPEAKHHGIGVIVRQSFKDPPLLIARNGNTSRIIWDPNPQLKNFELGEVTVYKWKDKEGRDWKGGLYKPNNYKLGQRYPLVVQTHGFAETDFKPSGVFPTAFAARALAASGIIVLQVGGQCPMQTPVEGSCQVSGYEAGAEQLVSDGLVDPDKIGIIGFSRTCYGVMEMLTTSSLHLEAASITAGILEDYLQLILFEDRAADDANLIIGARAVGEGLQLWLKRSPGFNLDKVTTPLLVVGEGPASLLSMWQPYAGLRYLKKPVDLMMLNTDEHVLSNPAVRMASQVGSVDWFRFWLQNYEDPDPTKAKQYARWRGLRKLQQTNQRKSTQP